VLLRTLATGATFLKRLIGNSLIAVLYAASAAPQALFAQRTMVSACCRRDGKHRCMTAMSGFLSNSAGAAVFQNKPADCPHRTHPSHLSNWAVDCGRFHPSFVHQSELLADLPASPFVSRASVAKPRPSVSSFFESLTLLVVTNWDHA
jgi:hypothetical protein